MKRLVLLVSLIIFLAIPTAKAQLSEQDSLALVALYDATNGADWDNNEGWLVEPACSWDGVVCNDQGIVTQLDLASRNLVGTIPAELGNITSLIELKLGSNQLSGSLPPELGQLTSLELLSLSNNQFTGSIPPELGQLSNLGALFLNFNQLSGPIPAELGQLSKLGWFDAAFSQLTGPIPSTFGQLDNLQFLHLARNQLTGPLPAELGDMQTLMSLWLNDNLIDGPIPSELSQAPWLASLWLFGNELSGSIPPELSQAPSLGTLWLYDNQLTGPIPPELGEAPRLSALNVSKNQLSGSVPGELGNLTELVQLILNDNLQLTGILPEALTALTNLTRFNFQNTGLCENTSSSFQAWLNSIETLESSGCQGVSVEEASERPAQLTLSPNYPNPVRSATHFRYGLPQPERVVLELFDVQGRKVATIDEGAKQAGWHETTFHVGDLPPGVYVYRLQVQDAAISSQMVLVQ